MVLSAAATNIQLGLLLYAAVVMTALKLFSQVEYLRSRHESSRLSCEVLMKLCRVEVSETVGCLLYRTRLAEVTWEALSVVSFILPGIGHVGCDVHQTGNRWISPGFSK